MKPKSIIAFTTVVIFAILLGVVLTWSRTSTNKQNGTTKVNYKCPRTEFLDCSDTDNNPNIAKLCNDADYINWIKENCPTFRGITR